MKNKINVFILTLFLICGTVAVKGQNPHAGSTHLPFKITFFSESIGIPNFSRFFKQSGFGLRVGTEIYYSNTQKAQFFQTLNIGLYRHKHFASALFFSTEAGYRRYFGSFFADATIGGGLQYSNSELPVYKPSDNAFRKTSGNLLRFIPTVGLGTGYVFNQTAVFARYELFGEMPFGYKGVPALPRQTIHFGTQFNL